MANYDLNIGQAELIDQRGLLERVVDKLSRGEPVTLEPVALDALLGLQSLCDSIADQTEGFDR